MPKTSISGQNLASRRSLLLGMTLAEIMLIILFALLLLLGRQYNSLNEKEKIIEQAKPILEQENITDLTPTELINIVTFIETIKETSDDKDLDDTIIKMTSQVDKIMNDPSSEIILIEYKVDNLQSELEKVKEEIKQAEAEIQKIEEKKADSQKEIKEIEEAIKEAKAAGENTSILERQLEEAQERFNELSAESEREKAKLEESKNNASELEEAITKLEKELEELRDEIIEKGPESLEEAENKIDELKKETDELKKELAQANNDIEEEKEKNDRAMEELNEKRKGGSPPHCFYNFPGGDRVMFGNQIGKALTLGVLYLENENITLVKINREKDSVYDFSGEKADYFEDALNIIEKWPLNKKMSIQEHRSLASELRKLGESESSTKEKCFIPMDYYHEDGYSNNNFNREFRRYYSQPYNVLSLNEFKKQAGN